VSGFFEGVPGYTGMIPARLLEDTLPLHNAVSL
jgi:hypothetical protein